MSHSSKAVGLLLGVYLVRGVISGCVSSADFIQYGQYCYEGRGDNGPMSATRLKFDPASGTGFEFLQGWWFPDTNYGLRTFADRCTTDSQDYSVPELYQGTYLFKHESLNYWMFEVFDPLRAGCDEASWLGSPKTPCWMLRISPMVNGSCSVSWILEARDLTGTSSVSIATIGDSWEEAGIYQYWRTPQGDTVPLDYYCDNGPGSPSGSLCNTLAPTPNEVTDTPTNLPTLLPTHLPTVLPTPSPTLIPTVSPESSPTVLPTPSPTIIPTVSPEVTPTELPTPSPTVNTAEPTVPTPNPTVVSDVPTQSPTAAPSRGPTALPSTNPTPMPTLETPSPSEPTVSPTSSTPNPTKFPTLSPTHLPTVLPTPSPTVIPTVSPEISPTILPTPMPTLGTVEPTAPTPSPTILSEIPTQSPTAAPSRGPTALPSKNPTPMPTLSTSEPTNSSPSPTLGTNSPTEMTDRPTMVTDSPTEKPVGSPTNGPVVSPTARTTDSPSPGLSASPTAQSVQTTALVTQLPTESPTTDECNGRGPLWKMSEKQKALGKNNWERYLAIFDFLGTPDGSPIESYIAVNIQSGWHDCFTFYQGSSKLFFSQSEPTSRADYTLDGAALAEASLICAELFVYQMAVKDIFDFRENTMELVNEQGQSRDTPIEEGENYGEYGPGIEECIEFDNGDLAATDACINVLLELNCWSPLYAASKLSWLAEMRASNDSLGWNAQGLKSFDGLECTNDCQVYSDVTHYQPQNVYDSLLGLSKFRIDSNGDFQINLNSRERRWAPLLESDGRGYYCESQHMVPHVGFTGQPLGIEVSDRDSGDKCNEGSYTPRGSTEACAKLDDPSYDYGDEAMLVIERVNDMVDDDYLMSEVDFFNLNSNVRNSVASALVNSGISDQALAFWLALEATAVNDAMIVSLREKVIFDLVRPITVIRALDDSVIMAAQWDRNKERGSIAEIRARDWQSYQRTKPTSEYPSNTACICKAIEDVTKALLTGFQVLDGMPDIVVDIEQPARKGRHKGSRLWYPNLRALARGCSQSRLNAGVHFSDSVKASEDLCQDIGQATFDRYRNVVQFGS